MHMLKTTFAIGALCAAIAMPALAQERSAARPSQVAITDPSGTFVDEFGTSFTFSLCGDGTNLCGVLNDVQGESRTEENLAHINQQVMQAAQTAPNQWKGTVIYNGDEAAATITQTGPDTVEIQGCRLGLLCETIVFNRT